MKRFEQEVQRKLQGLQIKQYSATVKVADGDRVLRIISSTEHVDRDGDILRQNWELENYRRAPRVQLWHGPETIGRSLKEEVVDWRGEKALQQLVEFVPEGESAVADAQWRLYRGGFLNQWSVGFLPKKITRVDDEDERTALGLGRWGVVFERSELMEVSAVPIPSNAETDTISTAEKMIRDGELTSHHMDALESANMLSPILKAAWANRKTVSAPGNRCPHVFVDPPRIITATTGTSITANDAGQLCVTFPEVTDQSRTISGFTGFAADINKRLDAIEERIAECIELVRNESDADLVDETPLTVERATARLRDAVRMALAK